MAIGFLFFFLMLYPYEEFVLPTPIIVFLGIGALFGLIILSFSQFEIVLIIFAVYIPFSREFAGDFGGVLRAFNLTNFLMLAIFVGVLNRSSVRDERIIIRTPIDVPLAVFAILGCISLFRASLVMQPESYLEMVIPMKQWITPMLGFFLFLAALKDRATSKKVAIAIMVNSVLIGILTIKESIDMGTWSTWERSRVDGVFQHSNTLGAFFVYYSFLIAGVFLTYIRNPRYWLTAIPFLICARGMMLTVSRGAIVSFAFAGLVTAFFKGKAWLAIGLILVSLAVVFPQYLPDTISGRFYSTVQRDPDFATPTFEQTLESSAQSRINIIKGSRTMIRSHPFLGMGYGMHLYVVGIDTHNTFLKIAVEMGLIALFVFILLLGIIFACTLYVYRHTDDRFMKAVALGFLGGLGGVAMCNFFGSRLDGTEFVSYFWILTAMMMKERHLLKEKELMEREKEEGVVRWESPA
jgi:cell division protein FtsW (lipid II flippase)